MKAARILAVGLALVGSAALVSADTNAGNNDADALNYALQLEYLESAYYQQGLAQYNSPAAFSAYPNGVYEMLTLIGAHEKAHVAFLQMTLGNSAGHACSTYNFTNALSSVDNFLQTAVVLEDTGVSAYVGAINAITTSSTIQAAATVATIEARHAAYLRLATRQQSSDPGTANQPFSDAYNTALTPGQVVAAAGGFFGTGCSLPTLPTVRPSGVAFNITTQRSAPSSMTPSSTTSYTDQLKLADNAILNYALTLEHLESDFYNTLVPKFSASDFNTIATTAGSTGAAVYSNLQLIQMHEAAHVSALTSIIAARSGSPVTAGTYDWSSITTPAAFLTLSATLENTGVTAYDGAANSLVDTGLLETAAAIATVEARHASFLNILNGQNATNSNQNDGNFDVANSMATIVATVQSLPYVKQLTGSTGSNSGSSGSNSASFAAPAIATAALALVAALLL